ncbi:glycosyltransferase family 39 protein, partial [Candidatus Gottesmanbacteria bacterium]|nr:glycosyltransferase family 39 protein [Candidatus Gottesmanbacteria bacterium]
MKKILLIAIFFLAFFLRFYKLGDVPPGLYIDEASIGYNAYSVLTTGKDEFGEKFPLWFRSFGDYKPPVYIYLTSVSMAIFGKNEWAVRFPSAFFGTLTVLITYFLIKKLFMLSGGVFALLTSLLLAISPWHLQFSRAAFEANVGLFLFILGTFLALMFWQKTKAIFLFFSFFVFGLTLYTYHIYRLITPIWLIMLIIFFLRNSPKFLKAITLASLFLLLITMPVIRYSLSSQGQARFNLTSAFAYQKPLDYPAIFMRNYLSYFSLPFLFAYGDGIGRHQIDGFGPLSYWQIPFFLIGLIILFKRRREVMALMVLLFLLLSPLPAALAQPSPHVLRSLPLVIPIYLTMAMGITVCWQK